MGLWVLWLVVWLLLVFELGGCAVLWVFVLDWFWCLLVFVGCLQVLCLPGLFGLPW